MDLIGTAQWELFRDLMRDAHDTFNQGNIITWKRSLGGLDTFAEDNENEQFTNINLDCLIQFNQFRTWPINQTSETGEIEKNSIFVYLNKRYLAENNYLDSDDKFIYDPMADRFIYQGEVYKDLGNTPMSQARGEDIFYCLILKKDKKFTGA